jgi:hypothetical protein
LVSLLAEALAEAQGAPPLRSAQAGPQVLVERSAVAESLLELASVLA